MELSSLRRLHFFLTIIHMPSRVLSIKLQFYYIQLLERFMARWVPVVFSAHRACQLHTLLELVVITAMISLQSVLHSAT